MTIKIDQTKKQFLSDRKIILSKLILLLPISVWCIGFSFPLFRKFGLSNPLVDFILFDFYGNVCHQQSEKLVQIDGIKLFICWRCAGIYIGALIVSFFNIFNSKDFRISNLILIAASVPMLIDVILHSSGIYSYNKYIAFITGTIFVISLYFYISPTIEKYLRKLKV